MENLKNVTPSSHESEAQAAKWNAIGRCIGWLSLIAFIFLGLVIYLAWHQLQATAPLLLYIFEALIVVSAIGGIYGLWRHQHAWHEAKLERYRLNTNRLSPVDGLGNYEKIYNPVTGTLISPVPGNYQQPVYQTYAPHITYHNQVQGTLPEHTEEPFQAALAPTIEEVIKTVPRNGLQVGLGRSLTSGEMLQIELPDNHIKLIGATRKGKSSMAGGILEQVRLTHDPNILQFALLDLENKTSRLFERSTHVAYVQAGRRGKEPAIARSASEVALWLRYLKEEMDRRYKMNAQQKAQLPYLLIYVEEFLDLRRRLKGSQRTDALDDFTELATRCLKERMALMVCAQVDYADEELRDAMAQFVGTNVAFSVKPSAARSAGFISSELLNKNYATRIPGQYVVEATGFTDLGISPQYDVRQKLNELDGVLEGSVRVQEVEPGAENSQGSESSGTRSEGFVNPGEPAWQIHLEAVWDLYNQGVKNQDQIIEHIWHVKKGGSATYLNARAIVQRCLLEIRQQESEASHE